MAETEMDKQTMFLKIQRTCKDPTSNKAFYSRVAGVDFILLETYLILRRYNDCCSHAN